MIGRKVVILGSGDVGLIMARRLTLEGSHVLAVAEVLPYPSGLSRNIVQCLQDYDIPLLLNHTVTEIHGKHRLEGVTLSQVDEHWTPLHGTERYIACDTLILSLGLIPENELSSNAGILIDPMTTGPVVTQNFETTKSGMFACGNCLQVYDTVDMLAVDAKKAGQAAASFVRHSDEIIEKTAYHVKIKPGKGIRYVLPQFVTAPGDIFIMLRVKKPLEYTTLKVIAGSQELVKKRMLWVNPAIMIRMKVNIPAELSSNEIEVILDEA